MKDDLFYFIDSVRMSFQYVTLQSHNKEYIHAYIHTQNVVNTLTAKDFFINSKFSIEKLLFFVFFVSTQSPRQTTRIRIKIHFRIECTHLLTLKTSGNTSILTTSITYYSQLAANVLTRPLRSILKILFWSKWFLNTFAESLKVWQAFPKRFKTFTDFSTHSKFGIKS